MSAIHTRALQVTAPGQFAIIESDHLPDLEADEVLIEVAGCATCTNWELLTWDGIDIFDRPGYPLYPQLPGSPGHEASGVVIQVGGQVTDVQVGDHVAVHPGGGPYENDAHCTHIIRDAATVAVLDPAVPLVNAAPLEMVMCALHSVEQVAKQTGSLAGKSVAVIGLGPAGILHLQAARAAGAARVIGIETDERRLEVSRPFVDVLLDPRDAAAVQQVITEGAQVVFDCAGTSPALRTGLDLAREMLFVFAVPKGEVTWSRADWLRSIAIQPYHWRGESQVECLRRAAKMLAEGKFDTSAIITQVMPYERYGEGLEMLKSREAIKIVFVWS